MQARVLGVLMVFVVALLHAGAATAGTAAGSMKMVGLGESPTAVRAAVSLAGLSQQSADINLDRSADQFEFVDSSGQTRASVRDLDFDGKADLVEFFSPSGEVLERQFQMDFDPFVDVVRIYEGSRLTQKLMATSFDGTLSLEQYYDFQGNLSRTARDTNFDGRADLWEYFTDGKIVNITSDSDGDGEVDKIIPVDTK